MKTSIQTLALAAAPLALLATAMPASSQSVQANSGSITIFGRTIPAPQGVYRSDRGGGSVKIPRPAAAAPLTASECRGLGGRVGIYAICKSGSVCERTDENGVKHRVCISKS